MQQNDDRPGPQVLIACPDSRPPAYEAVSALAGAGLLGSFETSFYYGSRSRVLDRALNALPARFTTRFQRRSHPDIPGDLVSSHPDVDLALAAENLISKPAPRRKVAHVRTAYFDRRLRIQVARERPDAVFLFSDVGSGSTLPYCQERGIPAVVSVVHGDPAEEKALLEREAERSPAYFPLYLGDGSLDLTELEWLHQRRAADRELASLLLVPSVHIADRLQSHGVAPHRIRVIPYAADVERFQPRPPGPPRSGCQFVFAGGITQRKGIGYLLAAWRLIQRPNWSLHLVGALPRQLGPLQADLDQPGVVWRGRVAHSEMPALMADADVFVFPSLFEGSAVVTYEALAAGLPSVVTREAGSVARDGIEGLTVPSADPLALAAKMEQLGLDAELRREMAGAARLRGEEFNWARYRRSVVEAVRSITHAMGTQDPLRDSPVPRKG